MAGGTGSPGLSGARRHRLLPARKTKSTTRLVNELPATVRFRHAASKHGVSQDEHQDKGCDRQDPKGALLRIGEFSLSSLTPGASRHRADQEKSEYQPSHGESEMTIGG